VLDRYFEYLIWTYLRISLQVTLSLGPSLIPVKPASSPIWF
jgi:hypothetical protein